MKPLVSVIVTTKNNERIIARCLHSIIQQSYTPLELVVVDNFSKDRTAKIASQFTKKIYQHGPERSAQRNFGARTAKGSYFLFIDSDMELTKNVVRDCVNHIGKHIALVIPERFEGKGFWTRCKILEKSSYSGTGDGNAVRFCTKKAFFAVHGYDEQLTGPEDIDFHKRIQAAGSIAYSSEKIIHHDQRLTLFDIIRKRYYYSLTLRRYLSKHPSTSKTEFRFIRPAYFRQWRMLLGDPAHLVGMFIMRFFEGIAVLLALRKSR